MDKYILFEPNSKLHQSGKVSILVVGTSSYSLALNYSEAGQQLWLLQPVFSSNKSWYTWIITFNLIQTHSYTSQGRFIFRSFAVVGAS